MIQVKPIKPSKLKEDAVRLELLNAIRRCGTGIRKDFEATTATWEHKPKFEQAISLTGPGPVILVETEDEIYNYVDSGTKAHKIPKDGPKLLAFPSGYTAKTVPNVIGSKAGGAHGETVFAYGQWTVKGIKPRNFDKMIQKKWKPLFEKEMDAAMKKAAKASGHAI